MSHIPESKSMHNKENQIMNGKDKEKINRLQRKH